MVHLLLAVIYLAFISLGLPDSLLGGGLALDVRALRGAGVLCGVLSMIIAVGTIVSSLNSDRLTSRFGPGRVTACSVALTALALLGFSVSTEFWMLCLWAVPYGLGAGSVDAALNNYVALHYASRHMSWLHCMWGVGTLVGPNLISFALSGGQGWQAGYRYISVLQLGLTAVLLLSLPLWKRPPSAAQDEAGGGAHEPLGLRQAARIPGAKSAVLGFFCYCALEQTAGLWAGKLPGAARRPDRRARGGPGGAVLHRHHGGARGLRLPDRAAGRRAYDPPGPGGHPGGGGGPAAALGGRHAGGPGAWWAWAAPPSTPASSTPPRPALARPAPRP